MSDIEETSDIISVHALTQFINMLPVPVPEELNTNVEALDKLVNVSYLTSLVKFLEPSLEIEISSSKSKGVESSRHVEEVCSFLEALDDATERKYSSVLQNFCKSITKNTVNNVSDISLNDRLELGEMFVLLAINSSKASDIVQMIMTSLDADSQLAIQMTIQKFEGFHLGQNQDDILDDTLESEHRNQMSLLSAESHDLSDIRLSSHKETHEMKGTGKVVPPLALSFLQNRPPTLQKQFFFQSTPSKSNEQDTNTLTSPVKKMLTKHSSFEYLRGYNENGDNQKHHPLTTDIWKKKFDSLKINYRECETIREELQLKNDQLKKELLDIQATNNILKKNIKNQTSASQKSVSDTVDTLEREVIELKQTISNMIRDKKDLEKNFENQIITLRDENQLLQADVVKSIKLEAALDKYKTRIEELGVLKTRNQELEKKVEDYMHRMIDAETTNQAGIELKNQLDDLKLRISQLEAQNNVLTTINNDLQQKVVHLTASVEDNERKRNIAELKLQATKAEYEATQADTEEHSPRSGFKDDFLLRERLARLEKENDTLRQEHPAGEVSVRVLELEKQLDDAERLKNKFEKEYQSVLAKMSLLDAEKGGTGVTDETVKYKLAEKENELLIQKSQLQTLQVENKLLQTQLEQEKGKTQFQEESIKTRLEADYDTIITTLKEQVQIRERELTFIRLARDEQTGIYRREERLMSVAFHELGYRYFQLKSEYDKTCQEQEAIMLKGQKNKAVSKETSFRGGTTLLSPRS